MKNNKIKILFVASEMDPFAKTGGLADVIGTLPLEIAKLDYEVAIIIPHYQDIINKKLDYKAKYDIIVPTAEGNKFAHVFEYNHKGVPVYFLDYELYFNRSELYGESDTNGYQDNILRFSLFNRGVLEFCKLINFIPDIFHCNDWHTALLPVYLRVHYKDDPLYNRSKVLFTIHNLAYQGLFPIEKWYELNIPIELYSVKYLEFWGKINLMKGGLVFSDYLSTVSMKYAEEIQSPELGCGLEDVLKERKDHLYGILNGIDYNVWNSSSDPYLYGIEYNLNDLSGKEKIKKKLLEELNLVYNKNIPLIGSISRLTIQKGFDLLINIAEQIFNENIQYVLLGRGDNKYHKFFEEIQKKYPKKVVTLLKYNDELAHKIEAGCDIFLMPSQYEPCGLNQLYSLKYGTIPVVRSTGGLADSIK
ncbi:MAG: glycogen synthase, partial [Spirochaetota bacterium]|nr:glycogen synthase [Spirochaetota bacterium]